MLSSEAPQAGKTTALSALVDFLPDDTTGIFVRGWWEAYDWTRRDCARHRLPAHQRDE